LYYNSNNNTEDNLYGAVVMAYKVTVIARVHPVHAVNAEQCHASLKHGKGLFGACLCVQELMFSAAVTLL